jgi:predicted membrane protein
MRIPSRRLNSSGHLFVGGLLILIGSLFLLDTLGIAHASVVVSRGWPVILILIGVARLFRADSPGGRASGAIWFFVGIVFFLSLMGYLPFDPWRLIWPVTLIALGFLVVIRSRWGWSVPEETTSRINAMAFFGSVDRRITSPQFEGGELTVMMGGCKIDLREAVMVQAEAVLDVFVVMGGIELLVPQDWAVISKALPVMGGFVDRTNPAKDYSKRLVIRGTVLMGGLEVKNF